MRWVAVLLVALAGCASPGLVPGDGGEPTPAMPPAAPAPPPPATPALGPSAYLEPGILDVQAIPAGGVSLLLRFEDGAALVGVGAAPGEGPGAVAETLAALGVTRLAAVFVLGPGAWNEGGCDAVFASVQVDRLYHYGDSSTADLPCLRAAGAARGGVQTGLELDPGQRVPVSGHATVTVLATNLGGTPDMPGSMALRVQHGDVGILAAGDLRCADETALLDASAQVRARLLAQGYPGGSEGGCQRWLDAVRPAYALLPDARQSAPDARLRLRLEDRAVQLLDPPAALHSDGVTVRVGEAPAQAGPGSSAPPPANGTEPARPQAATLRITAVVHEETKGAAAATNEYVEIQNVGQEGQDISGWTVRNDAGAVYTFPAGAFAAPGATLRVHTGRCEPSDTDYCWGVPAEVWAKPGHAYLWDRSSLVHAYRYGGPS